MHRQREISEGNRRNENTAGPVDVPSLALMKTGTGRSHAIVWFAAGGVS